MTAPVLTVNGVDLDNEPDWWGFEGPNDLTTPPHGYPPTLHGFCLPESRPELIEALTGRTYYVQRASPGMAARVVGVGATTSEGASEDPDTDPTRVTNGHLLMHRYTLGGGLDHWTAVNGTSSGHWRVASLVWGMEASPVPAGAWTPNFIEPYSTIVNRFAIRFATPVVAAVGVEDSGGAIGDLGGSNQMALTIATDEPGAALYAAVIAHDGTVNVDWQHHATNPGSREAFTLIDSYVDFGAEVSIWRLLDPTPTSSGSSFVLVGDSTANERITAFWYLTGVDQSDPDGAPVFNSGTSSASSLTLGSGGLALNIAAWITNDQSGMATPTAGGGQTVSFADFVDRPSGQPDMEGGAGYGSSVPTWTWSASHNWTAGGIVVHGS